MPEELLYSLCQVTTTITQAWALLPTTKTVMVDTIKPLVYTKQDEVDSLLTNNNEPSEEAANEIRRLLVQPTQELEDIDREIRRLESHLEELKTRRAKVKETVRQYRSILSPIRCIPPDVLREIFLHCLDEHRNPTMLATDAPMLLTRICSSWRSIALLSPLLWAQIHIVFTNQDLLPDAKKPEYHEECPVPRQSKIKQILRLRCEAVEEWLRRSGTCPLSISIHYSDIRQNTWGNNDNYSPECSEVSRKFFRILTNVTHRWNNIELDIPLDAYYELVKSSNLSEANNLSALRICCSRDWAFDQKTRLPFELKAKNLRRLSIDTNNSQLLELMSSCGSTLTYISFHMPLSSQDAASVLVKCPQLIHLKLCLGLIGDWDMDMQRFADEKYTFSLPQLRTLHINDNDTYLPNSTSTADFYNRIIAPQLSSLSFDSKAHPSDLNHLLSNNYTPTHNLTIPVCVLLQKSTKLKRLEIDVVNYTNTQMVEILHSASSISHLLYGPRPQNDIYAKSKTTLRPYRSLLTTEWSFDHVFLPPGGGSLGGISETNPLQMPLLPYLEKLEISPSVKVRALSENNLLKFIIHRMDPFLAATFSPLKQVKATFHGKKELDIEQHLLEQAKDKGLTNYFLKLDLVYSDVIPESSSLDTSATAGLGYKTSVWNYDRIDEDLTSWEMAND